MNPLLNPIFGMVGLSGGELILIAVVALVLLGANKIPTFMNGLGQGIKEFRKASEEVQTELEQQTGKSIGGAFSVPVAEAITPDNQTTEFIDEPRLRLWKINPQMRNQFILWLAQGFGVGRIPFAPGTFGSLVGLLWFGVLLIPHSFAFYVGGMLAGFAVSVWICGEAEKILQQKDPGSIVLDEIVAIPLCFFGLVVAGPGVTPAGSLPTVESLWQLGGPIGLPWTVGIFTAFRLFDIWKPWPVRPTQGLPGGWGVTVDDLMAAGYVNLVVWIFSAV